MQMRFNSATYEPRVRAHGILHQPEARTVGSGMVVLESCVNNILKLRPALLAVGALTSADEWQNGVIIIDTIGTMHPSNWAKLEERVISKKESSRLSKSELEELNSKWYNLPDMRQRL